MALPVLVPALVPALVLALVLELVAGLLLDLDAVLVSVASPVYPEPLAM